MVVSLSMSIFMEHNLDSQMRAVDEKETNRNTLGYRDCLIGMKRRVYLGGRIQLACGSCIQPINDGHKGHQQIGARDNADEGFTAQHR